eukprot:1189413-Prorocentrum_minimum.AAC.1
MAANKTIRAGLFSFRLSRPISSSLLLTDRPSLAGAGHDDSRGAPPLPQVPQCAHRPSSQKRRRLRGRRAARSIRPLPAIQVGLQRPVHPELQLQLGPLAGCRAEREPLPRELVREPGVPVGVTKASKVPAHQSREGRENIPAGGTSHVRGERIYPQGGPVT